MNDDLAWDDDGPRSLRYGDVYFSNIDGLAESRAVFLEGCGLPHAWAGRSRFSVAELGFGTGLNIAALLQLWRDTRPAGGHLSIFSVEAHPLSREAAERALRSWPELEEVAGALLARWPQARRGLHRIDFPDLHASLDLYVGEVGEALERWSGPADAWFLDGFAPSRNPQMWRPEVLAAIGRLSAPGARLASFTVAGHVRRGLAAAGFAVEKRPGFGAKRERLEGRLASDKPLASPPFSVAVIGGGVAGAALVRAFHRQGARTLLVEAQALGAGASGNPAALVTPRFDAGFGPPAELHAAAFPYAVAAYREIAGAVVAEGALQLAATDKDVDRFARIAGWDGFDDGALTLLDPAPARTMLAEEATDLAGALALRDALVIAPAKALEAWCEGVDRMVARVAALEPSDVGWRCLDDQGGVVAEADIVCIASGAQAEALAGGLGLRPVRGQAEFGGQDLFTGSAAAWGAYAIPTAAGGVLFGASHVRGDRDTDLRPSERESNLAALAARRPALAERVRALAPGALQSRAATRAATADHLPLAGALERPGLYLLGGLGGRGFTLAPLLAEHVAALALGTPSPLPCDLARRLRPRRFVENPPPA